MRADFDVPVLRSTGASERQAGMIVEPFRIERQKETLDYLLDHGVRVVLVAHISAVDSFVGIHDQLQQILGRTFPILSKLEDISVFLAGGAQLALLENVRQFAGEKENDSGLAMSLAKGCDIYVNNAFAVCHRAHASVAAVTHHLPSYAGLLVAEEVAHLQKALDASVKGKVVVIGGAKASTKVPVIRHFVDRAEHILVGGVVANDILKARGRDVGASLVDDDAAHLLEGLDINDPRLIVPDDFVITDDKILDIGPTSAARFAEIIKTSSMVIWNGPMGMFEDSRYGEATGVVTHAIAQAQLSIIGGGDTIAVVRKAGVGLDKFSFVSTGGGAMLAFLAGEQLPGLEGLGYYDCD